MRGKTDKINEDKIITLGLYKKRTTHCRRKNLISQRTTENIKTEKQKNSHSNKTDFFYFNKNKS